MLCPKSAYGAGTRSAIASTSGGASPSIVVSGGSASRRSRPGSCAVHTSTSSPSSADHGRYAPAPAPAYGRHTSRSRAAGRGTAQLSQAAAPVGRSAVVGGGGMGTPFLLSTATRRGAAMPAHARNGP